MKLAFCIFKYFPYGGLQKDFLRIAGECRKRGHQIIVYTRSWEGEIPEGLEIRLISCKRWSNYGKAVEFSHRLREELKKDPVDSVIGFNRMPNLDVYFAADNCLAEKAERERGILYRMTPRFRTYRALEKAVFDPASQTKIMILTERQKLDFVKHYGTQENRFHLLPPGMPEDRKRPPDADKIRAATRKASGIADHEHLLIQIGSGFITKGVGRSIRALASLPDKIRHNTRLWIVGRDNADRLIKLSKRLGIAERVAFLGGRDDVPALLLSADLMVHPAVNDAAATTLLEAIAAGLPVLCSAACGYDCYVAMANAGRVVPEPFSQTDFNHVLQDLLTHDKLAELGGNGAAFAARADFYSRHIKAVNIIEHTVGMRNKCSI